MPKELTQITTLQFQILLEKAFVNGVLDLSAMDLRNVDMRYDKIRRLFTTVTTVAAYSEDSAPLAIDLTNSNISGRDFSNYNLSSVLLTGTTARHAIFTNSDLTDVKFDGADLAYADCRNVNFSYCKLYNSSINGVNFNFSDLRTAYGLNFREGGEQAIERLSAAASIYDTKLPDNIEDCRSQINENIDKFHNKEKKLQAKPKVSEQKEGW